MKFSAAALLLLYAIASWESICCHGSQKVGVDGAGEVENLNPINHRFSRRLLETKNTNPQSGLKEKEAELQENEMVKTAVVEEKGKEKSETEEESSEMESNLILPEETDDSEPEIMEGQKKAEQQIEQNEQQDTEPMIENKELMEEERKIELKSDLRERKSDLKVTERGGRAETKFEEFSKLEAEEKRDSEHAVDQKVFVEEVEALTNVNKTENKAVAKLQKETESEKQKQRGNKSNKGTEGMNAQDSSVTKDTKGKKMQHETDSKANFEGKGFDSELVSLSSEGSEDGTVSDVAMKVKKRGNKVSDSLSESESELMEGKRKADIAEVKLQKTAENNTALETPRNSKKGNAQLNLKTIKERKPRKERKRRKMSKMESPIVDKEIRSKVSKSEHTISDDLTKAMRGKKATDSMLESEPVERVLGLNKKADKKLGKEAEETLDAEQKEETQRASTRELSKASPKKTKERALGKEKEGEENSELELQILSEGNEVKDTDALDEISDAVTKAKKETEQVLDSESESELMDAEGWNKELEQKLEDTDAEAIQVETHKNAANNQEQKVKLKETEQEETSDVDEETPEKEPSKKIQEKEPEEIINGKGKPEVDLQATKEEKAVAEFNGDSKKGQQSGVVKVTHHSSARDSDDEDEDDDDGDFMQDFADLPSKFQDTAHKLAGHLGPNIQKITDTSKVYFNKANHQITESFSPLVGKQYAPFLASLISYGLLLLPLAVVIILFEHIRTLLSLQTVLLFVNSYLAAYFATLLLATFIIGSEPMTFFYKNSTSGYLHLQLLQALGYVAYLGLLTFDVIGSCSSETLSVKVIAALQWLLAVVVGLHYYVTVFHRAMGMKGPRTSWKIYGMYSIAFSILSLFARIKRIKKGYSQLGDVNTDKKN